MPLRSLGLKRCRSWSWALMRLQSITCLASWSASSMVVLISMSLFGVVWLALVPQHGQILTSCLFLMASCGSQGPTSCVLSLVRPCGRTSGQDLT